MKSNTAIFFLYLATFLGVANGQCSFCYNDRTIADFDKAVPRMSSITQTCVQLLDSYNDNLGELQKNRGKCIEHQLLGYQTGCCTTVNSDTGCGICREGDEPQEGFVVPTDGSDDRNPEDCTEGWAFQPYAHNGVFEEGVCSDTRLQRAGFYCGCRNEYQENWMCPTKEKPLNPKRGDFLRFEKCGATEFLFSLFKAGEVKDPAKDFGFDYPAWCQCPGVSLDNSFECKFCPDDTNIKEGFHDQIFNANQENVRDPNGQWDYRRNCAQVLDYTRYVTNDNRCQMAGLEEARAFCCPASTLGMYLSAVSTAAIVLFNLFF